MDSGVRQEGDQQGRDSPGSVTMIVGDEELLVERAVSAAVAAAKAAREAGPDGTEPDVHDVAAAGLTAGELAGLTAPSLFGGGNVVVIRSAENATASLSAELTRLAGSAAPDVSLILTHSGGAKNKALLAD